MLLSLPHFALCPLHTQMKVGRAILHFASTTRALRYYR